MFIMTIKPAVVAALVGVAVVVAVVVAAVVASIGSIRLAFVVTNFCARRSLRSMSRRSGQPACASAELLSDGDPKAQETEAEAAEPKEAGEVEVEAVVEAESEEEDAEMEGAGGLIPDDDEDLFKLHVRAAWCKKCRRIKLAFPSHKSRAKRPEIHQARPCTAEELRIHLKQEAQVKRARAMRGRQAPAAPPVGTEGASSLVPVAAPSGQDAEEYWFTFGIYSKGDPRSLSWVMENDWSYLQHIIRSKVYMQAHCQDFRAALVFRGLLPYQSAEEVQVVPHGVNAMSFIQQKEAEKHAKRALLDQGTGAKPQKQRKANPKTDIVMPDNCSNCGQQSHHADACPLSDGVRARELALMQSVAYKKAGQEARLQQKKKYTQPAQCADDYVPQSAKRSDAVYKRTYLQLCRSTAYDMGVLLVEDEFFEHLQGKACVKPNCVQKDSVLGRLCGTKLLDIAAHGEAWEISEDTAYYRCKFCRKVYHIAFGHPLYKNLGHGSHGVTPSILAYWSCLEDKPISTTSLELGVPVRTVSFWYAQCLTVLAWDALAKQSKIKFGGRHPLTTDVEYDGTCFQKWTVQPEDATGTICNYFYCWMAIVERGQHGKVYMAPVSQSTDLPVGITRAHGLKAAPPPEDGDFWQRMSDDAFDEDSCLVGHADSAKAFTECMPKGVEEKFHVCHEAGDYTHPVRALENVMTANRRPAKTGTMTVDRFWRYVKSRLPKGGITARTAAGRRTLWVRIRAAQWKWMVGPEADRWSLFCDAVRRYRESISGESPAREDVLVSELAEEGADASTEQGAADDNRTADVEASALEHASRGHCEAAERGAGLESDGDVLQAELCNLSRSDLIVRAISLGCSEKAIGAAHYENDAKAAIIGLVMKEMAQSLPETETQRAASSGSRWRAAWLTSAAASGFKEASAQSDQASAGPGDAATSAVSVGAESSPPGTAPGGGEEVLVEGPAPFSPTLHELSCNLEEVNTELLTEPDTDAAGFLGYDLTKICGSATVRGMSNIANTCYINAMLAALSAVPAVRCWSKEHLQHHEQARGGGVKTCLACQFGFDLQELSEDSPWPFKPLLALHRKELNEEFRGRHHHCIGVAFQSLLERCHAADMDAFARLQVEHNSQTEFSLPKWAIFGSRRTSITHCPRPECKKTVRKHEMLAIVPLSFPETGPIKSLREWLEAPQAWCGPGDDFGLPNDDRCDEAEGGCGTYDCRWRKVEYTRAPGAMAIHLQRALSDTRKNVQPVPFDTELAAMGSTYILCSVVVHEGGAKAGHYTCFALIGGTWWLYDDNRRPVAVAESRVLGAEATLLFYTSSSCGE